MKAARAMMICSEAGINIKRKAIWRDRKRILKGLPDGELKSWLASGGALQMLQYAQRRRS